MGREAVPPQGSVKADAAQSHGGRVHTDDWVYAGERGGCCIQYVCWAKGHNIILEGVGTGIMSRRGKKYIRLQRKLRDGYVRELPGIEIRHIIKNQTLIYPLSPNAERLRQMTPPP